MRARLAALLTLCACSQVRDLRILGLRFEPPELLADACDPNSPLTLQKFAQPVELTALLADPKGEGRDITLTVTACADTADRTCTDEGQFKRLATGTTKAGEKRFTLALGTTLLPDFTPLLQKVLEQDSFGGLGGIRVPVVVKATAADEIVYAQKLMLYSCRFFPQMKQNVNPELPGMTVDGGTWLPDEKKLLSGAGPFRLLPEDFATLEEPYTVPSFTLQPVSLQESWKVSWHTTLGKIGPTETGGTDLAGQSEKHRAEWAPGSTATEQDVDFWFVARDGRGGLSWITRSAHYVP
jgi:hypothetical protein